VIREALQQSQCDAVSIARSLVANNDLVNMFAQGLDRPLRPCTYCNKCAINTLQSPLGCYELSRFGSHEEMVQQIMTVFDPPPVVEGQA
jgi:2,4-dienoyl-CoA reductase-like NADH-dependent reductase (Old Yellow Enzyme family)